jgi:hypothetical protein
MNRTSSACQSITSDSRACGFMPGLNSRRRRRLIRQMNPFAR